MGIVSRIGLVIHWFGFLLGAFFFAFLIFTGFEESSGPAFFTAPFLYFLFSGLGWLIRYILVGRIKLLPWKKI